MTADDPLRTRRDAIASVADDLSASGYEDAEEVGRGGFGEIYRCRQVALDRTVAVKVLTAELGEDNQERFFREQRAMGRLTGHPNIVTVLQVGVTKGGRPYLVMPYHPLDSLDAWIRRQGPLPVQTVLWIGVKVAGALESAHRLGIVHPDVKPTLAGIGGVGKTRLALRAAANSRRDFADGVRVVELADVRDPSMLVEIVAAAFGLRDDSARSTQEALVQFPQSRETLLIMDNCEQAIWIHSHAGQQRGTTPETSQR